MGNRLLRIVYRIIILTAIFVASIFYFSRNIKEVVFNIDNTTVMEDATFPLVTIKTDDVVINQLHGYSSNLEANSVREAVTPLGEDQSFEININQESTDIKKLNYELRDFEDDSLIESDSVSVFETDGNIKTAKIKIKAELSYEKAYAVKITLITKDSRKIYFYHRVIKYNDAGLKEKLSFVMDFHNAILKKDTARNYIKYLEPKSDADNSSFAKVNINSSFDLVSWGDLNPEMLTEVIPTVTEIYSDIASIKLTFMVQVNVSGKQELYEVKEFFRVRYTADRMYLLNYDRSMEAFFDPALASASKSQLKLGISSVKDVPYLLSPDNTKLAFVRNGDLWFYNLENNEIVRVFSFRQDKSDYIRDLYDQHDVKILNLDAEGNIDFLVYGYMNRGQYEGKTGIILYNYIRADNRIEERAYIPVEEPYQSLKENLGSLAYVNSKSVFYFYLYNNIYSYDLITRKLTELADQIDSKNTVVIESSKIVAWQGNSDPRLSKEIKVMNLETGEITTISAKTGYNILLMDIIDSNLIYGYAAEKDISTLADGRLVTPMEKIEIASTDGKVLKNYSAGGYYVTGITVDNNIIELKRVKKDNENGKAVYKQAPDDYIMNQEKDEVTSISVTARVTKKELTELYLTLPAGFTMNGVPKQTVTVNTVINQDPTLRLTKQGTKKLYYYPYVAGEIKGSYEDATEAVKVANDGAGVVMDSSHRLIWERGVKSSKNVISGFEGKNIASSGQSLESCIKLLMAHLDKDVTADQVSVSGSSAYEILQKLMNNTEYTPVCLTGMTLDDVLYYVSKGRPVIAMTNGTDAVLIYSYDTFNISVVDPKFSRTDKIGLQDSKKMFEKAGNIFISYLE